MEPVDPIQEKRQFKRIKKPFMARVQFHSTDGRPYWDMVTVQDLSEGGLLFNYANSVELGTVLNFKINLPAIERSLEGVAKIVRNSDPIGSSLRSVAAHFTHVQPEDIELIRQAAEGLNQGTSSAQI